MLALASSTALADPPSDASIRDLFAASKVQNVILTLRATIDKNFGLGFASATANNNVSAEQQRILDHFLAGTTALLDEQLTWAKLEPSYLQVYRENFTQEEVDALSQFYRTPAGKALIEKMPMTMARAAQLMQPNMQVVLQQLQALQADVTKRLAATEPQRGAAQAPPPS